MVFLAQNPVKSSKSINVKNDSCKLNLEPIFYSSDLHIEVVFQNTVSISRKTTLMSEKPRRFSCEYRFLDTLFSSISKFYIADDSPIFSDVTLYLLEKSDNFKNCVTMENKNLKFDIQIF